MNGFHGKNIMSGKKTGKSMKTKPSGQFNPSIKSLLSFILAFSLILISIAPALIAPVSVYAAGSVGTLKAFLIGLSAVMGVGNIDPSSISYMNNNTVLSAPLEDFVGDNPIYTTADLNAALSGNEGVARWTSAFANNAASVKVAKQYITSSGGDPSGLDGLGGASAGENIISSARYGYNNYKTNGNWDLRPSIGGQTMTDAINATAVMTAMSNYAYNFDQYMTFADQANLTQEERDELWDQGLVFADQKQIEDYLQNRNKTITSGININESNNILNKMLSGGGFVNRTNRVVYYFYPSNIIPILVYRNGIYNCNLYNISNVDATVYYYIDLSSSNPASTYTVRPNSVYGAIADKKRDNINGYKSYFTSEDDAIAYVNSLRNNTENIPDNLSPSLIGSQGQLSGTSTQNPTTNNYNYNINVNPIANYNTYNYRLPSDEEISTMISEAQTAINQGQTQEDIAEIFNQFAQQIRSEIPVPTAPPVVPDQPTPDPKPTGTPEQQQENQEIMATPELKDKFPFCIPWDVYYAFAVLEDQREAPALDFDLDLGPAGTHHIEIDFSEWEDIAALLRLLELLAFIIGLAIATKRLMGGTGA